MTLILLTGAALIAMFNEMNTGLYDRPFEWQNSVQFTVGAFLGRFDYIFTLNQDLLLERHCIHGNQGLAGSKFSACQMPGTKLLHPSQHVDDPMGARVAMRTPDTSNLTIAPGQQPYIKLHGSSNLMRDGGGTRLLVLGGGKEIEIGREPLLKWYHEQFSELLCQPGAKLMVIGYSFGDAHINEAIGAAADGGGLSIFIVDPEGVDVLDKSKRGAGVRVLPQPLVERLSMRVRGASRRPLSSTFGGDRVEHAKLVGFLSV